MIVPQARKKNQPVRSIELADFVLFPLLFINKELQLYVYEKHLYLT